MLTELPRWMAISHPDLETGLNGKPATAPKEFLGRWVEWAATLESGDPKIVQIRAHSLPSSILFEVVKAVRSQAKVNRVVVNGRVDVALAADADGVQLPGTGLPVRRVRNLVGGDFWIGQSVHSPSGVDEAQRSGADWALLAPIFAPLSKESVTSPLGVEALREGAKCGLPIYALGGMTVEVASQAFEAGAHGVAGITLFADSERLWRGGRHSEPIGGQG